MPKQPSEKSGVEQFLVAGRESATPSDLKAFEEALGAIPDASVLKRSGRTDRPRLVVALKPEHFEELRARFAQTLIMEPNSPLTPQQ
jgi:hypothetical protein